MNTEILQRVVAEWLHGTEMPELTPREQAYPALDRLKRVLAVVGPRRAGKTYFLFQMILELLVGGRVARNEILFVDFEDYRLTGFQPDDMEQLLAAFYQQSGKPPRYLFFDEVQHLPQWSRILRTLHNTRRYVIVVTGSNAKLLSSEIATELRGRYEDCLVLPFSFREYLRLRKVAWDRSLLSTPQSGLVVRAFDEYLKCGGFPEAAGLKDETAKRRLMQMYFDTVFYRDVLDRYGARARHLVDVMMRNMLEGFASSFSISTFEKQIKAHGQSGSKRSIANYLRHLEEVFFVAAYEKFDFSPRKRMMNPKKVYLMDTGFSLLSGAFTENKGRLLENVVALEFFRNRRRAMYYKGRSECDFILQDGTKPTQAWQVCWELSAANEKRELGGLAEAMQKLKIAKGGILTYNQQESRSFDGVEIEIQPVWKWLLE